MISPSGILQFFMILAVAFFPNICHTSGFLFCGKLLELKTLQAADGKIQGRYMVSMIAVVQMKSSAFHCLEFLLIFTTTVFYKLSPPTTLSSTVKLLSLYR